MNFLLPPCKTVCLGLGSQTLGSAVFQPAAERLVQVQETGAWIQAEACGLLGNCSADSLGTLISAPAPLKTSSLGMWELIQALASLARPHHEHWSGPLSTLTTLSPLCPPSQHHSSLVHSFNPLSTLLKRLPSRIHRTL